MTQVIPKKWYKKNICLAFKGILVVSFIGLVLSGCASTPAVSNTPVNTAKVITNTTVNTAKPAVTNTVVNNAKPVNTSAASVNTSKVNTSVVPVNTTAKNVVPVIAQTASACLCDGSDLDCGDFSTHEQAQTCYTKCLTAKGRDVFGLDGDNDGSACEANTPSTPAPIIVNSDTTPVYTAPTTTCCKVCSTGKACGDSCISRSYTCHKAPGCACDG